MEKSATQWMTEPLKKYAVFSGRARRAEYWWYTLLILIGTIVLAIVDVAVVGVEAMDTYGVGPLTGLFALATLLPSLGVSIRRLHDLDKSGWWLLLAILPLIGGLILLFWYVQRGTTGDNSYGPDPLYGTD